MLEKRITIIGCGGIGSWLAHGLSRAMEYQAPGSMLTLVDGDNFEPKNAERQTFTTLGNKAHVLRNDVQPNAPRTFIISKAAWVVCAEKVTETDPEEEGVQKVTAHDLMRDGDHVFCVVDNYAARKLVFDAARDYTDIDIYTGGNDERLFGSVYHYSRRDGRDVTHHPSLFHDEFISPQDRNPGELSCQERAELDGGTQLLAVNMAVSSWLLGKAAHAIFGTEEERASAMVNSEVFFDLEAGLAQSYDRRIAQVSVGV